MNEYVVDTVARVLRLEARVMGSQAQQIFVDMEQGKARLHVPTMVFAEILYLADERYENSCINLRANTLVKTSSRPSVCRS